MIEQLGFFGFHVALFVLLFWLLWRAKNVSAFFKLFLSTMLVVLFVSPVYMQFHNMGTQNGAADIIAAGTAPEITPLSFTVQDVRSWMRDATWTRTVNEDSEEREEMFETQSQLFGVVSGVGDQVYRLDVSLSLAHSKLPLALLDLQLLMSNVNPKLVESGWISGRVAQVRSQEDIDYVDTLEYQGAVYSIRYTAETKKLQLSVVGTTVQ